MFEIYALLDRSGRIRYIGKTSQGAHKRLRDHWGDRTTGKTPKDGWLRSLDAPPDVRVLAIVEDSEVLSGEHNIENLAIRAVQTRWPGQIMNVKSMSLNKKVVPRLQATERPHEHPLRDPRSNVNRSNDVDYVSLWIANYEARGDKTTIASILNANRWSPWDAEVPVEETV